ncbi:MAG: hypothetical protein HF982_07385 [Desulfobacteraceae bacterium]|nr:hypothetical protein [Desulfobacteraceae bacterium]MBC2719395.1 hypothetical protein [Desulfobacteraceae bacterium]
MTAICVPTGYSKSVQKRTNQPDTPSDLLKIMSLLGMPQTSGEALIESLPFSADDVTAGSETELQTAVCGNKDNVDLAIAIKQSSYYRNIVKRAATGESPRRLVRNIENYLANTDMVWEHSWVRLPRHLLCEYANAVFARDIQADKRKVDSRLRRDAKRFVLTISGIEYLRLPVSYLLKLSLAHAIGKKDIDPLIRAAGEKMMSHFLNDNTSPETHSFCPIPMTPDHQMGKGIAGETSLRFLLSQFLIQYANRRFGLLDSGQQVQTYFAPHPPVRQRQLNELIPDAFYRELYMSPCLSGWDQGEIKRRYMGLCHEVLSRSQLNAVVKLKEAGIITNNLVVLPNTSNISLANNGIHVSLGSRKLTRLLGNPESGFTATDEKYYGDLVIKICEHFLPLFVGTYSAAPYRLDFQDFHPEKVLGFLPHELDYTHLRMIWRRWKKKAGMKFFGYSLTPFGPESLDSAVSRFLCMKGDYVYDFRLINYPVALLSTDESPAIDGRPGNEQKLKDDLASMGVFHRDMPLYMLYRLRVFDTIGFSGFEGRYYSLFNRFMDDMAQAVNLQLLITALAYKYIFQRQVSHAHIPDDPTVESERRQIFFGAAIGIPTFFVHKSTGNQFMEKILRRTHNIRKSQRYAGFLRVHNIEYRRALLRVIREDAKDLVKMMHLEETLSDLERRINEPEEFSAAGRLTRKILDSASAKHSTQLTADEFNLAAEKYYREVLKKKHMQEGLDLFACALKKLDSWTNWRGGLYNKALLKILNGRNAVDFLAESEKAVLDETLSSKLLEQLIHLMLLVFYQLNLQCIQANHD